MKLGSCYSQNNLTTTRFIKKYHASLPLRHLHARPRRKITGKERDSETGLYYYGARYLDPKASRWLSGDPAVGEYVPSAPVSDEARKRNGNLPGMGGVFNYVNLHVYHYGGNNPVRYIDPDGRDIFDSRWFKRNGANLLSLTVSGIEIFGGISMIASTGITGAGAFLGSIMITHGSLNALTMIGKITVTTIAANLHGDDYADRLNGIIPNTAIGVTLWSIALAAETLTGFSHGNIAEKAGAIGDFIDIAVGLGVSMSASISLSREIESFIKSSGNLISRSDLLRLQQYLRNIDNVKGAQIIQGFIDNFDRVNGFISGVDRLND